MYVQEEYDGCHLSHSVFSSPPRASRSKNIQFFFVVLLSDYALSAWKIFNFFYCTSTNTRRPYRNDKCTTFFMWKNFQYTVRYMYCTIQYVPDRTFFTTTVRLQWNGRNRQWKTYSNASEYMQIPPILYTLEGIPTAIPTPTIRYEHYHNFKSSF